ncbi:MAG: phosphoenolpyruvate--protein phosphotransferase [Candidatus Riflebacteria bacterium]|nr:phosphoenolpyruvate--protein phosphotransferase [Candidatus Riflebacteria bacterium]
MAAVVNPEKVDVFAPLSGFILPLEIVPDPVFAQKLVGDGVSIDPTSNVLTAPVAGEIIQLHAASHALTIRTSCGAEILIHIGLDTVKLSGKGFDALVSKGAMVTVGQPLIKFNADFIATNARSLLTQVLVTNMESIQELKRESGSVEEGSDVIFSFLPAAAPVGSESALSASAHRVVSETVVVVNPSGLHARPASVLAGLARQFSCELQVQRGDRTANARSVSALMALEVEKDDKIVLVAIGEDAEKAIEHIVPRLKDGLGEDLAAAAAEQKQQFVKAETTKVGQLAGIGASRGVAIGKILKLRSETYDIPEAGRGHKYEQSEFGNAVKRASLQLSSLQDKLKRAGNPERAAIFSAHAELLDDPELLELVERGIMAGKSAAFAWHAAFTTHADRLRGLNNQLLAARANDLKDLGYRVLRVILSIEEKNYNLIDKQVIIAEDLTPSNIVNIDKELVVACCTVSGGATSHVAILARSMGLPAIVGLDPAVLDLEDGTMVVVDGNKGILTIQPDEAEVKNVEDTMQIEEKTREEERSHASERAVTSDGVEINVVANLGDVSSAEQAVELGAEGIGLLRSEFLFMNRAVAPSEDEQYTAYLAVAEKMGKKAPIIIRTIDVGGDKPLPYLPIPQEENPFLGERGIRVCLNRPEIFITQLRAILRVAQDYDVRVMFPMIAEIDEWRQARKILHETAARMKLPMIKAGIMIEVPSAAMLADNFAAETDFFSIGTNDLSQYMLAMDRGHPKMAGKIDAMHPSILRMMSIVAEAGRKHKIEVGVCGGLASDIEGIAALIGLGINKLSVDIPVIATVKAVVRRLSAAKCSALVQEAIKMNDAKTVRLAFKKLMAAGRGEQ